MSTYGTASSIDPASLHAPIPSRPARRDIPSDIPIPFAAQLTVLETALALAALALVVVVTNVGAMPYGLDAFLSIRLTLRNILLLALLATGWAVILRFCGLYDYRRTCNVSSERARILIGCSLGSVLALLVPTLSREGGLRVEHMLYFWPIATGLTLVAREVRRGIVIRVREPRRVLIVGSGPRAFRVWDKLRKDARAAYDVVGFIDTPAAQPANPEIAHRRVGTLNELERILMHEAIDELHVALPVRSHYPDIQEAIAVAERIGVQVKYGADLFDCQVAWPRFDEPDNPTVTLHVVTRDYRRIIKRAIDLIASTVLLVGLLPLMLMIAAAIKLTSPGPVLFAQERYGLNRRRFWMLKFRTMVVGAERLQEALEANNEAQGPVFKIAADPRVTPLGRFLRRTSLDELPQLFNVLRGAMSLVGPRPLPLRDVKRFTRASDMRRFSVLPGLTCLWQVQGRNTLSFDRWIELDLEYIDKWSLWLDVQTLVRTIPAVLSGTGAN